MSCSCLGTGKTYLGVKIAELLLHNRSVWCPQTEENSPILMVCQTNHALDQFLEHIINRLKMNDGRIRSDFSSLIETFILVLRIDSCWWSMPERNYSSIFIDKSSTKLSRQTSHTIDYP